MSSKKPKQERSRFTVDSIIEAAVKIINGDIKGNLTTNKIAEVAGVSVGSLYQYFRNKESIIEELVNKKMISSLQHFFDKIEGSENDITADKFIDSLVREQFASWKSMEAVSKTLMRYVPKVIDFSHFFKTDKLIVEFLIKKIDELDIKDLRSENLEYSLKLSTQIIRTSIYTYFYDPDSYDYDTWVDETSLNLKRYLLAVR